MKRKLLLVSNRLPVTIEKRKGQFHYRQSVGGLATGLSSLQEGHNQQWIGWCGLPSNSLDSKQKQEIRTTLKESYLSHPVFLSKRDIRLFYAGFCNKTIWPLFHYFPEHAEFDQEQWESYIHVNRLYSQAIISNADPYDIIWIHDYHLMLAPQMVREVLPDALIGFFIHIPFPSYEIFRLLPWRKEILQGLLCADQIGFHTYDYVRHFNSSVRRLLGYEHTYNYIHLEHRMIQVDAFPMGVDYEKFAMARPNPVWMDKIRDNCRHDDASKIVLSVDRMDYTKGIPQRLEAFDYFLDRFPQYKKRVTLILVAVPSRTSVEHYQKLKSHIDQLVGRINGKHGTIDWMPVWYLYRFLSFQDLAGLYRLADICLVTPLRDGMNLIAKEYIASRSDDLGILILSEMAGATGELPEALIVNPNNKEEIANTLAKGLIMSDSERSDRMHAMKERLQRYNVTMWAKDFINRLGHIRVLLKEVTAKRFTANECHALKEQYQNAQNRLILLNDDGTLIPYHNRPQDAEMDEALLQLLERLTQDHKNTVVIISGRQPTTMDRWFSSLELNMTAESGLWHKVLNSQWEITEVIEDGWKKEIQPILEFYVDRTPGALIEEKPFSLVWHYRRCSPELGAARVGELKEALLDHTSSLNLIVTEGNQLIEVKIAGINKGKAARHWLGKKKWDFILAIGNDWTDEDMFEAMPNQSYTVHVGMNLSKANYFVPDYQEVRALLAALLV